MFVVGKYAWPTEEDYLDSLKKDDSYFYSIPFTWGSVSGTMDVEAEWSDDDHGYIISFSSSESDEIEENGDDLYECFESLEEEVLALLDADDIPIDVISLP